MRIPRPCQESTTAPARIAAAPSRSLRSTFSRKTTHAIAMVASPSRFNSSEPDAAEVRASPSNRNSGPMTPPKITTAISQSISARRSGASKAPMPSVIGRPGRSPARCQPLSRGARQEAADSSIPKAALRTGPTRRIGRPTPERRGRQAKEGYATERCRALVHVSTPKSAQSGARWSAFRPIETSRTSRPRTGRCPCQAPRAARRC